MRDRKKKYSTEEVFRKKVENDPNRILKSTNSTNNVQWNFMRVWVSRNYKFGIIQPLKGYVDKWTT